MQVNIHIIHGEFVFSCEKLRYL